MAASDKPELRVHLDHAVMQRFDAMCQLNGWDRVQGVSYLIATHTNKLNEKAIRWLRMTSSNPSALESAPEPLECDPRTTSDFTPLL